jgi:hypothetical protein
MPHYPFHPTELSCWGATLSTMLFRSNPRTVFALLASRQIASTSLGYISGSPFGTMFLRQGPSSLESQPLFEVFVSNGCLNSHDTILCGNRVA